MKTGWKNARLGDVADVQSGGTPLISNKKLWNGGVPWYSSGELNSTFTTDPERFVSVAGLENSNAKLFPVGSLLIGMYDTAAMKMSILDRAAAFNQAIAGVKPNDQIDIRFVFYALNSLKSELLEQRRGVRQKNLSLGKVRDFEIPFPPLEDQQRIVALLDEAFDGIATARACAEKNLQNARAIFETHLQSVFTHRGTGWFEKRLADVCAITSKLVDPRKPEFLDLTHVGAGNIESKTGAFVELKTAREEGLISGKFLFDETMVLYSKIRPYLMKVARPDFSGLCSADMYPLAPNPGETDKNYLFHLLLSKHFTDYAIEGSARAGMPKVNREHLFEFRVCLPSVSKQREIAAKLDALHEETQRLESLYQRKLTALNELKNSLLHQAFSGQLTSAKPTSVSVQAALQTTTPEFTANIISLAHARHERQKREKTFGHVKEQKLLHLVESIARIDLGRRPMKDAAGPNDFPHMRKAEEWAKAHHFFEMVKRDGGYDFKKLSAFDEHFSRARQALAPYLPQLESVIDLLVPMDTGEAEVFATVHAAWNNLLIDGLGVTDDAIVSAAREGWHADKLSIPKDRFRAAIALIRQKNLVPDGTAKYVGGQPRLI